MRLVGHDQTVIVDPGGFSAYSAGLRLIRVVLLLVLSPTCDAELYPTGSVQTDTEFQLRR